MEIERTGSKLTVRFIGEINSTNAPEIEKKLLAEVEENGIGSIVFDLKDLEYMSSAGLRILLIMQKKMRDGMTIINVNSDVEELFTISGYAHLFNIGNL